MTGELSIDERRIPVWGSRVEMAVQVAGVGPPLLYLHPAAGLVWDTFLERLSGEYTVYAPMVPGTAPGRHDDIAQLDDLWDLVLVYEETIRGLELEGVPVIGASFGGMLALELAAHSPRLFSRLAVLAPVGLWLDEHPVANWVAMAPHEMPGLLFHRPDSDAAVAAFTPPADPDAAVGAVVGTVWAIGCTAKFVWPIPDKGLAKRLHRVEAPTLVVWGEQDALIPSAYAAELGRLIPGSQVEIIDQCGHYLQLEQIDTTWSLVRDFLGEAG